ncbi:thiamine phosphate synthase [Parasphingopyxis sp. CP4]|nr:thiamine phosphate synthase [Parasphingopyxis sp. CP4]
MAVAIDRRVRRRHPLAPALPKLWLMTDERQGDQLWPALDALPRGSGVIVRHYSLSPSERRVLVARIRKIADGRGLVLVTAGSAKLARSSHADGFHARSGERGPPGLIRTMAAHNLAELRLAERVGADLVFFSPVFATESHPGAPSLGRVRFGELVRQSRIPVIALGGMTNSRAQSLAGFNIYGWAAIGALTPDRN